MNKNIEKESKYPVWLTEKGKLLEKPFCDEFLRKHLMWKLCAF